MNPKNIEDWEVGDLAIINWKDIDMGSSLHLVKITGKNPKQASIFFKVVSHLGGIPLGETKGDHWKWSLTGPGQLVPIPKKATINQIRALARIIND